MDAVRSVLGRIGAVAAIDDAVCVLVHTIRRAMALLCTLPGPRRAQPDLSEDNRVAGGTDEQRTKLCCESWGGRKHLHCRACVGWQKKF